VAPGRRNQYVLAEPGDRLSVGVSCRICSDRIVDGLDGNPEATFAQRHCVGLLDFGRWDCGSARPPMGGPALGGRVNEVEPTDE